MASNNERATVRVDDTDLALMLDRKMAGEKLSAMRVAELASVSVGTVKAVRAGKRSRLYPHILDGFAVLFGAKDGAELVSMARLHRERRLLSAEDMRAEIEREVRAKEAEVARREEALAARRVELDALDGAARLRVEEADARFERARERERGVVEHELEVLVLHRRVHRIAGLGLALAAVFIAVLAVVFRPWKSEAERAREAVLAAESVDVSYVRDDEVRGRDDVWVRVSDPASDRGFSLRFDSPVTAAVACSPYLYVATRFAGDAPSLVHKVDLRDGTTVWSRGVVNAEVEAFFTAECLDEGKFWCSKVDVVDMDGDGVEEVVALFRHSRFFPCCVRTLSQDGDVLDEYLHWGYLYDFVACDVDGDGGEEVIAYGTNNCSHAQGATVVVLSSEHRSGGCGDCVPDKAGWPAEDVAARVVIPAFPSDVMRAMGPEAERLHASRLEVQASDEGSRIFVDVGDRGLRKKAGHVEISAKVELDESLNVLSASLDGSSTGWIREWVREGFITTDLTDPVEFEEWLAGRTRVAAAG